MASYWEEVRDVIKKGANLAAPLADRVLMLLQNATGPLTRTAIREHLRINNQRLGHTLDDLQSQALAFKTPNGWIPLPTQRAKQLSIDTPCLS